MCYVTYITIIFMNCKSASSYVVNQPLTLRHRWGVGPETPAGTKHDGSTGFEPPQVRPYKWLHIIVCGLRWLPVRQRIDYKKALLTYKIMSPRSRSIISDETIRTSYRRAHCRETVSDYHPRHTNWLYSERNCLSSRPFGVSGPTVWNSFPVRLRDPTLTLYGFKTQLKAYMFTSSWFPFWQAPLISVSLLAL